MDDVYRCECRTSVLSIHSSSPEGESFGYHVFIPNPNKSPLTPILIVPPCKPLNRLPPIRQPDLESQYLESQRLLYCRTIAMN
jgi:hypothetical protein